MMTYGWIWQIHLFLMLEMSKAEVPDIIIGDMCVMYGGQMVITCTFNSITIAEANKVNWYGPGGNLDYIVFDGDVVDPTKYEASTASSTLSLTIKNIDSNDIGQYKCDYKGDSALVDFSQSYIEDINCISATGGIGTMTINIGYNDVVGVVQEAKITADTNSGIPLEVDCSDDPVGQSTTGTCIFNKVPMGQYKYTVYSHGKCELTCSNGTNLVEVDGVPTTTAAPTTAAPTTVAPTTAAPTTTAPTIAAPTTAAPTTAAPTTAAPTTAAPTTAAPTTAAPATTDATTSKHTDNFQIIYAVVGSLGGIIIIFAIVAILIYKNRKHKRSVEKKQSRPKQSNQFNGRSSHQYDNRAFIDSAHGHMYNTGRPYASHVSSHSYSMSPVYQQQDRNDRNHLQGHKPGSYFSGGSNRDRPLNVKYYTGQSQRY